MIKKYCAGNLYYSQAKNIEQQILNPKTKQIVKIIKSESSKSKEDYNFYYTTDQNEASQKIETVKIGMVVKSHQNQNGEK